jgi:hypothetical protein
MDETSDLTSAADLPLGATPSPTPDLVVDAANSTTGTSVGSQNEVPTLVGGRVETAREIATVSGWEFHENFVDPTDIEQPDGLVVAQAPSSGVPMTRGSALVVDVVKATTTPKTAPVWLLAIAVLFAAAAGVFAGAIFSSDDTAPVPTDDQVAALESDLAAAVAANSDLDARAERLAAENADVTAALEEADAQIAEQAAANRRLRNANTELTEQLEAAVMIAEDATAANVTLEEQVEQLTAENAVLTDQITSVEDAVILTQNLVGGQLTSAQRYASQYGLVLVFETVETGPSVNPVGTVLRQEPQPGTPLTAGSALWVQVAGLGSTSTD